MTYTVSGFDGAASGDSTYDAAPLNAKAIVALTGITRA